jgi:uncharacterized protein (DUF302 family)
MHYWGDGLIHTTWTALLWIVGIMLFAGLVWVIAYNVARSRILTKKSLADAIEELKHPSAGQTVFKSEREEDRDPLNDIEYGFLKTLEESDFEQAHEAVVKALKNEGFGILTEIDVSENLKKKLNVDFRRYVILGACNASIAHEALCHEPHVGLLLPYNVVLQEKPNGELLVSIAEPNALFKLFENPEAHYAMLKSERRLKRALEAM